MKNILFIFLLLFSTAAVTQPAADIIIRHGKIVTMDDSKTVTESVAIGGGVIIATGTDSAILKYKSSNTKMIDARGHTVIPGLFDSHLHVIRGGKYFNAELRWDGVKTLKRALAMLREQAARTPPGQWVRVVGGWNEYQFEEKRLPTLEEINEATGNVPTFILYLYAKAWLNKAALEKLQITATTPNPAGGLIEKDAGGNPTGLLIAEPNAFILYATLAKLPELSFEEKMNSTMHFMLELNRLGLTAAMDAGGGFQNFPEDYAITDSLSKMGKLSLRLPHFLFAQKRGGELDDYNKWTNLVDIHVHGDAEHGSPGYYISGGGENLVADAADFENFLFPRPELPATMEANLAPVLRLLIERRWPFRLHATYNESISRDLDVIESVNKETALNGLPWFIDHAETISEENIKRIKALGGGIAIQDRMAFQGESFIRRYGRAAAANAPPVKTMLEAGIPVGLGTDGTRVSSYNPWIALYWLITGKTIGGTTVLSPANRTDRFTALKLMTAGGYALLQQTKHGKISKEYPADIVILDRDYFTVPEEQIKETVSLLTIVNGKIVYSSPAFIPATMQPLPVIPAWSPVKYYGGYQF